MGNSIRSRTSSSGGGTGGGVPITDPTIIAEITNDLNWDEDGNYTGSTTGLVNYNFYYDDAENQKYEYYDSVLRRISYNTYN